MYFSFLSNVTGVIAIEVQWQKWNLFPPPFLSQTRTGLYYKNLFTFHRLKLLTCIYAFVTLQINIIFFRLHILFANENLLFIWSATNLCRVQYLRLKYAVNNCIVSVIKTPRLTIDRLGVQGHRDYELHQFQHSHWHIAVE